MVLADYNDKNYDYTKYWQGRDYEKESEFIALKKFLPKDFDENRSVIDVGGGFGRLLPIFKDVFGDITIFDYSQKLLLTANENARDLRVKIKTVNGDVNEIATLVDKKFDYVTMIRVSHHLDNLEKVFSQIGSILQDDGIFILEVANKIHFKSVISNFFKGNFKYFSRDPVSIATKNVTFLNHHPKRVEEILDNSGFVVERKLSVSNFRHKVFKNVLSAKILLGLENIMQELGIFVYFGPSIFYKLTKK